MTYNQHGTPIVTVMTAPAPAPASAMREETVTMMPMPVMLPMRGTTPSKRSRRQKRGDPRDLTLVRMQYVQLPHLPSSQIKRLENPIAAAVINQRLQHFVSAEKYTHQVTNPPEALPHRNPTATPLELLPLRLQSHVPPSEVQAYHPQHHNPPQPEVILHHGQTPHAMLPQRLQQHVSSSEVFTDAQHLQRQHTTLPPGEESTTERLFVPVPLVPPGQRLQNRVEEVEEDYEEKPILASSLAATAAPNIILVRPIMPIAASFRQLAWRAFNAISRPFLPLITLWRSGRGEEGVSSELCCSMLMCELERIRENGGTFRIRLAQILR